MSMVLCIEDEAHLRQIIAEELEDEGYGVLQAADGREGLKMILEHNPDMVVSDITMPNMNGHELLLELRTKHPKYDEIPFVFLSALADRRQVIQGLELGADDYLTKPIDYDMLLVKIRTGLRQSGRVEGKHQKEQIKLFKALTTENVESEATLPEMPPRQIALVGASDRGLFETQHLLERFGHEVTVFTSGRSYLNKVNSNNLTSHLTLLWIQTDDMQGPMIINAIQDLCGTYVLVVSENLHINSQKMQRRNFNDVINLPMDDHELTEKIASWTE